MIAPAPRPEGVRAEVRSLLEDLGVGRDPELVLAPRTVIAALGERGILAARWAAGSPGDPTIGVIVAEELARVGATAASIGASLHMETATGLLVRYDRSEATRRLVADATAGVRVGCIAASEAQGGSDLSSITTWARRTDDGWRVVGAKKYVTLADVADFAIVLCRAADGGREGLVLAVVPRDGYELVKVHETAGVAALCTAAVSIDATIPHDAVITRIGLGLAAVNVGLSNERLAIAAQVVGGCLLAIGLATEHLQRRHQFGAALIGHQALRLRLAELSSEVRVLQLATYRLAEELGRGGSGLRDVAGLKVRAARLGERVASECMHMFGGAGYLEDETPMARLWRDMRLARIGGGTDEMMLELVASDLTGDAEAYDRWVHIT